MVGDTLKKAGDSSQNTLVEIKYAVFFSLALFSFLVPVSFFFSYF